MVLMSSDLDFVPGRWDPDLGSDVLGPGHPKPGCPEAGCLFAGSAVWDFGVCLSVPQLYLVLEMLMRRCQIKVQFQSGAKKKFLESIFQPMT